jgi:hypothetical protein
MPTTPEQIAKELVLQIKFGEKPLMANDMRDLIASSLREYGEACVKEAWGKNQDDHFRRVRNAALEEAAKAAEEAESEPDMRFHGNDGQLYMVSEAIRALLPPDGKAGEGR